MVIMGKYYNLSSSQFINYLGFNKYIKGTQGLTKRNTMLNSDITQEPIQVSDFVIPFGIYGSEHEIHALKSYANYRKFKGKDFNFILDNQKSFEIHNWTQIDNGFISLSSTPDFICDDFTTIGECKAGGMGKGYNLDQIIEKYVSQIYGQQMVLKILRYPIQKTHFVNWAESFVQIYEILPNPEYEKYLIEHLESYAEHLISEKEFTEKIKKFDVDSKLFNLIQEVEK